jgi:hypothetical protein
MFAFKLDIVETCMNNNIKGICILVIENSCVMKLDATSKI